jgi:TolA-binding protein
VANTYEAGRPSRTAAVANAAADPNLAPKAMFNLGLLEDEQGQIDQARHWYQAPINTDHPDHAPRAMFNLGRLEARHGQIALDQSWLQAAIDTAHPGASLDAQRELERIATGQDEQHRGRHWAQYGY